MAEVEEQTKPEEIRPEDEVLDLSALAPERPRARIKHDGALEGELYELAVPGDFGVVGLRDFGRQVDEMDRLWERETLSASQELRLEKILNTLTGTLIRDCPPEVIAAVPAVDKRGLVVRFFVSASIRTVEASGVATMAQAQENGSGSES